MRGTQWVWIFALSFFVLSPAAAKDKKPSESPDKSLVLGDGYTLRLERHGVHKSVNGVLVKLNANWIVLTQIVQTAETNRIPGIGDIPLIGPIFSSTTKSQHEDFLWIPRDAAIVEKHFVAPTKTAFSAPREEAPPEKTACGVEFVLGEKVASRHGGMEAVTAERLTVSVPKQVTVDTPLTPVGALSIGKSKRTETHYERQLIPRADLLLVRMANFDAAAAQAQTR